MSIKIFLTSLLIAVMLWFYGYSTATAVDQVNFYFNTPSRKYVILSWVLVADLLVLLCSALWSVWNYL